MSPIVPSRETLCPASPSLQWVPWTSVPHLTGRPFGASHRYYDPLRLPNAHPGFVRSSLSAPGTLCCSIFRTSLNWWSILLSTWFFPGSPPGGIPATLCTRRHLGSPLFPSYPFEHMPWSQTPAVSRTLAISRSGLLPSAHLIASAFLLQCRIYPCGPQLYIFRGSIHSLCSCSVRLQTPVARFACGFRY